MSKPAIIFSKIEIILIIGDLATTKVEFESASYIISGGSLIISMEKNSEETTHRVFSLNEMAGFKTYTKITDK